MKIFKNVCYNEVKTQLIEAVLKAFKLDRNGTAADRDQLGRIIKCYVDMGMNDTKPQLQGGEFVWLGIKNLVFYTEEFETPLLRATQQEYQQKAAQWIGTSTAPEYLTLADQVFTHEEDYCEKLLQQESKSRLLSVVELELIFNKREVIADKETGCRYMIENKRVDELKLMFNCYSRNDPNLGIIVQRLNDYIIERGTEVVQDQQLQDDPKKFTKKLLDFKEEIDKLLEASFKNNIRFEKGRDSSFQQFMNLNKATPALIANYTDMEMR